MTDTWEAGGESRRPAIDAGKLWAGGLATALVAALIAAGGILIARGVFDVPILAPKGAGVWGDASTGWYALGAAMLSLVATGLVHVLVLFTPRPMRFFGWLMVLATVVAVLAPFVASGDAAARFATATLNLILGVAIGTLVAGTARSAIRAAPGRPATGPDPIQPGW
jgi:Family of unknown function (DUF6069)